MAVSKATPQEAHELTCRLRQLLRAAEDLPANKSSANVLRIARLKTAIEGTLASGTLDVVQVQQLIVAVEAVKEEVAKLLAKAKAKAKEEERVEREAGSSSPSSSPPTSTFSTAQEGPSPVTPVTPPVSSLFSPAVSPPQANAQEPPPTATPRQWANETGEAEQAADGVAWEEDVYLCGSVSVGSTLEVKRYSGRPLPPASKLRVLWQRVHYEDGVPHATALPSALGCSSIKVTAEHLGFYLQVVLGILMDVNLGATVLLKTKSAVVAAAPGETPSDMDVAKNSSGNKELERKKSLEMQEHTSQRRQQALQKLRKSVRNVVKMNNVVSNMARREVMTSKKTSGKSKERRVGISAQPSNGLHVDAAKTQPLVRHAKSEAVRALLTKVLAKHFLFSQLNKGSLSEMVDFMFHIYVPQGHAVVNQGDKADNFYIIESGTCDVVVRQKKEDAVDKLVGTLAEGDSFGEMALLYQEGRTASIIATQDCHLWAVDSNTFNIVLAKMNNTLVSFLAQIDAFRPLSEDELTKLSQAAKEISFQVNEKVIVKGDVKDRAVYIILDGIVLVKRNNQADIQLGRGTVLGMDSLVSGAPRSADCVAAGPVKVVQIPPEVFWELVPKLKTAAFEDNLKVEALRTALGLEFFLKDISDYLPQFERRNYRHGDTVTQEGEYATHFMVISLGQMAVSRQLPNGSSHLMGYLGVRESIGGRALLAGMPHQGSVVVHSHTATVLCLPGERFMAVREMVKRKAVVRLLGGVSILKGLQPYQLEDLSKACRVQRYQQGDTIVRKGEFGDSFFVVQKGEVVINLETSFKRLGRGHCFGERAFLRKTQRRTATVQASTDVDLLVIDTLSFEGYLGDLGLYINQLDNLTQDEEVTLADLEILTEIGVGQYGRVKLVKSKKTGATYAMKCLEKRKVKALGQVVHVRNEKQIMAQLDHPFIVKLVSTCKDAVQVYMVMELCLGGELFALMNNMPRGRFNEAQARFYLACVTSAFQHMHSMDICYRDLKPENLLLDNDGFLKVTDFGFSKALDHTGTTFTLCGTADYLAPELIMHKGHGKEVDLWALGVLAYELICGCTPFAAKSATDPNYTYRSILEDTVYYPKFLSKQCKDLIGKLLVKDERKRLGSGLSGIKEVMAHPWFASVDWDALVHKRIKPPFKPSIKNSVDVSNFDLCMPSEEPTLDPDSQHILDDVF